MAQGQLNIWRTPPCPGLQRWEHIRSLSPDNPITPTRLPWILSLCQVMESNPLHLQKGKPVPYRPSAPGLPTGGVVSVPN